MVNNDTNHNSHNRFIDGQLLAIQATTTSMAQKTRPGHRVTRQVESTTMNSLFFRDSSPGPQSQMGHYHLGNKGKTRETTFGNIWDDQDLPVENLSSIRNATQKKTMSANGIETFPRHRAHHFAMEKGDNDDDAPGRQLKTPFFPVLKKQRPWRGWSRRGTVFLYLTVSY